MMEDISGACFTDTKTAVPLVETESATENLTKEDVGEKNNTGNTSDTSSIYRYIKDGLFTSEIYKVEIQNLPKYIGFNEVKKFLAKYGLIPHKIKLFARQTFAFVTFKSEEGRDRAMKVLHGAQWKNRSLTVKLAKPKADPIIKKRKREEEEGEEMKEQTAAKCLASNNGKEEPLSKQIADVVTPLWNIPYEEQLARKKEECEQVLLKLTRYFFLFVINIMIISISSV